MSGSHLGRILHDELRYLEPHYARARLVHAPLSAYPTIASLVHRLTDPSTNAPAAAQRERSGLLAVVIGAYQPAHDRLWGAILVAAFRPLVGSKRFYGADPEEREAFFFAALTEVVDALDVHEAPDQVHAFVWRRTKRVLVRRLRQHKAWSEVGFGADAETTADPSSWLPTGWLAAWLLSRGAEDRPDVDLVARVEEWGSVRAYAKAKYAAFPPLERRQAYERLRLRHHSAVTQLRAALGAACQPAGARGSAPPPPSGARLRLDVAVHDAAPVAAAGANAEVR